MKVRYFYRVLGTTTVLREDGTPVPVGGARLRALLTALALAGGRAVRTDELSAGVWADGEPPPADETAALQALVGRLRRSLGREAVTSADGGYRLAADRDDIDLFRFERLAGEGTSALADGDPDKAAALLDDALGLWHGTALADLPDGGGAAALRAEDRHLAARRDRAEVSLALGRADAVLPVVRQLATDHPLDEPLQSLHLRALRDAGRTAEALAAYNAVRVRLADRLGVDPGAELRALHAELLAESGQEGPGPGARAGTAPPYAAATGVVPAGLAPSVLGPSVTAAPGAMRSGALGSGPTGSGPTGSAASAPGPLESGGPVSGEGGVPPGNLRAGLTSFVGRAEEIGDIGRELGTTRLITLTGPGGAGKTRLSLEAAASARAARHAEWADGVWVAELAPVRDAQHTAETVLTALGGRETVIRASAAEGLRVAIDPNALDPLAQLAERCASRSMLLVLDNCEHVIDAAAQLVETLLVECPGVTVLATSREPLGVPGESVRPVEPLPDPVALRLLADRGASARPGFRTDEDPEACAEICRRLDGLPLAIELAAARLRSLTPRQLARRLDDRFRLLTSGSRTVLPRQQTLRAVVDWSWELLNGAERAVLRRLAVFSGGCELEQIEEVCGDVPEAVEGGVPALLGSLVDKSLVVAVPVESVTGAVGMRYRLLETVGDYAADKLDSVPGERAKAERRHLVAYRELARTVDPLLRGSQQGGWLDRLEREHDNIRTALRRAAAARDEQEVLCLTLSMGWFWQLRDHRSDVRTWTSAACDLGPDPFARPVSRAPALYEGCTDAPPPMGDELLWEARRGVRLMALAGAEDGITEMDSPERQEELRAICESYTIGAPQTCRLPGCMWIFAWIMSGRYERLQELSDAMVRGCRDLGYEWELAFALQLRSKLTSDWPGSWKQSGRDAVESLEIFTRVGDAWGEAEALSGRAESLSSRGDFEGAAEDYRMAIARAEQLGAYSQVPLLQSQLGAVLVELDDPERQAEGDRLLRESTEEAERVSGDGPNFAAIQLGTYLARRGETEEARALLEPVERQFDRRAPELFGGMVQGILAWVYCLDGEPERALELLRVAIAKTRGAIAEAVAPQLTLSQLLTAVRAYVALGGVERGARLLGAYDALTEVPEGHYPHPVERESRASAEAAVRAVLSEEAYAVAHTSGGGLSLPEAVALVIES